MFLKYSIWAWLWSAALLTVCLLPGSSLPEDPVAHADKIFHAGAFALLALLLARGLGKQTAFVWPRRHAVACAIVFASAFGALIELLQETVAVNRSADLMDWAADTAGALAGVACYSLWVRRKRKI